MFSHVELQAKARAGTARTMERGVDFDHVDIEEFIDFVRGIAHGSKCTQEEKSEIQLKVELLYDKDVIQAQEEDPCYRRKSKRESMLL